MVLVTCMDRSALCAMTNDISKHNHNINLINENMSIFLNHYHFIPRLLPCTPSPPTATPTLQSLSTLTAEKKSQPMMKMVLHWVLHYHFKQVADPITYISALLLVEVYCKAGSATLQHMLRGSQSSLFVFGCSYLN
jgi:hypothetical protein